MNGSTDDHGPSSDTEKILLLFDEYYESLYCFLRRFTPPRETEDLCQLVFLELCNRKEHERSELEESSLFEIARAVLSQRYKPLQRIHRALINWTSDETELEPADEPQPTTTRWLRRVSRELATLPSDVRQSVRLVIAEGISLQEAAERMGVTTGLVESWTSTGLKMLTERMCNHDQHT